MELWFIVKITFRNREFSMLAEEAFLTCLIILSIRGRLLSICMNILLYIIYLYVGLQSFFSNFTLNF